MNGFLGADPDDLRAHAQLLRDAARRLHARLSGLGRAIPPVPWTGRDADMFRARARSRLRQGGAAAEALGHLADTLEHQAVVQDAVSTPDADLSPAVDAAVFASPVPIRPGPDPDSAGMLMSPLAHRDPANAATAEAVVTAALRKVPGLRTGLTLSAVLGGVDTLAEGAHGALEDHGLEPLAPVLLPVDADRAMLRFVVGEGSSFDRLRSGLEESVATTLDTKDSLATAAQERDPWAAGAAVHEFTVRNLSTTARTVLPPAPAAVHTVSELIGATGDDLGPILPAPLAHGLDRAEGAVDGIGDAMDRQVGDHLGAEAWLRAERRFLDRLG